MYIAMAEEQFVWTEEQELLVEELYGAINLLYYLIRLCVDAMNV